MLATAKISGRIIILVAFLGMQSQCIWLLIMKVCRENAVYSNVSLYAWFVSLSDGGSVAPW